MGRRMIAFAAVLVLAACVPGGPTISHDITYTAQGTRSGLIGQRFYAVFSRGDAGLDPAVGLQPAFNHAFVNHPRYRSTGKIVAIASRRIDSGLLRDLLALENTVAECARHLGGHDQLDIALAGSGRENDFAFPVRPDLLAVKVVDDRLLLSLCRMDGGEDLHVKALRQAASGRRGTPISCDTQHQKDENDTQSRVKRQWHGRLFSRDRSEKEKLF